MKNKQVFPALALAIRGNVGGVVGDEFFSEVYSPLELDGGGTKKRRHGVYLMKCQPAQKIFGDIFCERRG